MPFQSARQRRFMRACHPVIAEAWAEGEEAPRDYRSREARLRKQGKIPSWCEGPTRKRRSLSSAKRRKSARRKTQRKGRSR